MSSFKRADYQKVFQFARRVYVHFESTGEELEQKSVEIMDLCEDVLGQQYRPDKDNTNEK